MQSAQGRHLATQQSVPKRPMGLSLLVLVMVAVFPLLIFGSAAAWMVVDQQKRAIERELANTSRALQVAVDQQLLSQLDLMQLLATDASLDTGDMKAFEAHAARAVAINTHWRNIALIDSTTYAIVASVLPLPTVRAISTSPAEVAEVARTRLPMIVGLLTGQIVKQPVIQFRLPVVRGDTVPLVLTVVMDPQAFSDLFAEQQLPSSWTGAVLDKNMVVAERSRDAARFIGKRATPTLANQVAANSTGMFTALNQEGATVNTLFSRSKLTGWAVAIGVPAAEVDGPNRGLILRWAGLASLLVALALALSVWVGRSIQLARTIYETALQDSEARLHEVLDQYADLLARLPIGVYRYRMLADGGHRFEFVSPQFCKQVGVDQDQILKDPESAFACFHAEDLPLLLQSNDEARQSMQAFCWQGRVNTREGVRWLRMESTPSLLPNGDMLWNGMQYDITEGVLATEKVKALMREQQAILNSDLVGMATVKDGHIVWANSAYEQMLGYAAGELAGAPTHQAYGGEVEHEKVSIAANSVLASGGIWRSRISQVRKDGQRIWVDVSGSPLQMARGESLWCFNDITLRVQAESDLIESELHLKAIVQNEPECIKIVDAQGLLLQMNPAGLAMIEADTTEQVIGKPVIDVIAPEYRIAFSDMHKRVLAGETVTMEFEVLGLKGGRRWLETHAVPLLEHGQTVHLAVSRDITERRLMQEQVRHLAFHDALTNLPNRRLLLDRMAQTMAASKRSGRYGALMFMDLDNFKPLNDVHGHEMGDLLLIEVAERMRRCVREIDTVARFGGDEFVVMLSELNADRGQSIAQAQLIAEKIRLSVAEPYELKRKQAVSPDVAVHHHCTASIGVVLFLGNQNTKDEVLAGADQAMYAAKEAGRNAVHLHQIGSLTIA